jgi:hypothetical protein
MSTVNKEGSMPKKKTETADNTRQSLSKPQKYQNFSVWLIGTTPLIVHAWSEKARRQMLEKQVGAVKPGKERRDPDADFVSSLYSMGDGNFGFPVTGIKKAILASAHKDRGIARTDVMAGLYLDAKMVRTMPAESGAICDLPLIRIWGSNPEKREDMVRIGAGLNKTSNLAYRAQFTVWAFYVTGKFDPAILDEEKLQFLISRAGLASGIGEWRNERHGVFGSFRLADPEEEAAWNAYRSGTGPLPVPQEYRMAAE